MAKSNEKTTEEVRYRRWHPTHGAGYYVSKSGVLSGTFEADSGFVLPMNDIVEMGIGKHGKRLPKSRTHEDWQWQWLHSRAGEVFVLRDSPPGGWPSSTLTPGAAS